ncbi:MAG: DUF4352 domain-containing protein [Chloroflexota bacterium]
MAILGGLIGNFRDAPPVLAAVGLPPASSATAGETIAANPRDPLGVKCAGKRFGLESVGVQMLPPKKLTPALLIVLLFLAACSKTGGPTTATASPTPPITATATSAPPTPSSPGDSILWDDLQVAMDQLEITQEYLTEFGSTRLPPAGKKFLWARVQLKNIGTVEMNVPVFEHFSILYAATEIKPIYAHRSGYADYTTLSPAIFPDQEMNGWLRFDIPVMAELKDMLFVFIPESAQVGSSFTSPNYPYADDKPTYVWNCAP